MDTAAAQRYDTIVFETGMIRIGAFRCSADHPSFHNTGPAENFCFVFPRTAVEIEHEHEPAFVANPNIVTFYNSGQAYQRKAISPEGDHCDWFGVDPEVLRDVVRTVDPCVDDRPDRPFLFTRGSSDSPTYLLQRSLFTRVTATEPIEPLAVEELVLDLLERVVRSAYETRQPAATGKEVDSRQRSTVHEIETILSRPIQERLTLTGIAREVGLSAFHVCRLFRRVRGTRLHQYLIRLRLRSALEEVARSCRPLTDIALDAGFSSHSHFTAAFRNEFGSTPSEVRGTGRVC